jgi:hypothetical protein
MYGQIEVKLAIARFIGEFLLRVVEGVQSIDEQLT